MERGEWGITGMVIDPFQASCGPAGGLWLMIDVSTHCRGLKTVEYSSLVLMTGGRLDASL